MYTFIAYRGFESLFHRHIYSNLIHWKLKRLNCNGLGFFVVLLFTLSLSLSLEKYFFLTLGNTPINRIKEKNVLVEYIFRFAIRKELILRMILRHT